MSAPEAHASSDRVEWDPRAAEPFAHPERLEDIDVAIHLSGANVAAKRWTAAYKREIVESRTVTTAALARTLSALARPPRVLLSASATGIYGDRGDQLLTEASAPGKGFLCETCQAWEAATAPASAAGIRVVHLRLGVVLSPRGGALATVLPLFRAGLGGRLGDGRQWMSWIVMDDLVRAMLHLAGFGDSAVSSAQPQKPAGSPAVQGATTAEVEGAVNCITPSPITNAEYTRALAATLHRPAFVTAPAFALRVAVGEMADAALLASCRAAPDRLLASGFRFLYPEIGPALRHVLAP